MDIFLIDFLKIQDLLQKRIHIYLFRIRLSKFLIFILYLNKLCALCNMIFID